MLAPRYKDDTGTPFVDPFHLTGEEIFHHHHVLEDSEAVCETDSVPFWVIRSWVPRIHGDPFCVDVAPFPVWWDMLASLVEGRIRINGSYNGPFFF